MILSLLESVITVMCYLYISNFLGSLIRLKSGTLLIFDTLVGQVILSIFYTVMGLCGFLYNTWLQIIFIALFIVSISIGTTNSRFLHPKVLLRVAWRKRFIFFLILGFVFLSQLRNVFLPVGGYDGLAYLLYQPYFFANFDHIIKMNVLIPNMGLAFGSQSFYGWLILFNEFNTVAIFHLILFFNLIYMIYELSKSRFIFQFLVSLSVIYVLLKATMFDAIQNPSSDFLLSYVSTTLLFLIIKLDTVTILDKRLILFIIGFLPFIKILAAVIVIPLIILVSVYHKNLRVSDLKYVVLGISLSIFWYVRNLYDTGNPFFPLLQANFKGLGYGSEIYTFERGIRDSFSQFIQNLNSLPALDQYISGSSYWQIAIIALCLLSLFIRPSNSRSYLHLALFPLTLVVQIAITGPHVRYALYILLCQLLLVNSLVSDRYSQKYSLLFFSCMVLVLFIPFAKASYYSILNLNTYVKQLDKLSISSIQFDPEIDAVVDSLEKSENSPGKTVGIVGEGRGLILRPYRTLVLPWDRSNPFCNPSINSIAMVKATLNKLRIDYLLVSDAYDTPSNLNRELLVAFEAEMEGEMLYRSQILRLYRIKN